MRRLHSTLLTHAHDSHKVHDIVAPYDFEDRFVQPLEEEEYESQIMTEDSQYTSGFITETEESDIPIVNEDVDSLSMTKLSDARKHLASKYGYTANESFSKWLRSLDGFIILPLPALSLIRKPDKRHKNDPTIIIYSPTSPSKVEWTLNDALDTLMSNQ